ncbi:MAG: S8/S53 family peptidase [Thalassobaculum sp.]|uniref:S8/S53 family peptidase n=1 Tax=Thalassobaculum sp. TaxID=2022740 RepID=UPI0032EB38E6
MGVWSVGIVDSGVVDEFEAIFGPSAYSYDYYYGNSDTDGSRTSSHGTYVAQSIEYTNVALERIDLQISSNSEYYFSTSAAVSAFGQLATLHDAGWHIGAVNVSWGASTLNSAYVSAIDALADRGILTVAAAGNGGSTAAFDFPIYPAALSNVIAVGSHDGAGNPSGFSQNYPGYITVLADGEGYPEAGVDGTSFAAPQVAAGVATVQALADAALERRLSFSETVDVLQQGGGATLSNPDPADGVTRYHLFDQNGSVNYFLARYLDPEFSGYEYMASYGDLASVFAGNPAGARSHLIGTGVYEGREVGFDGLEYIASHGDLIQAFGTARETGALHYLNAGQAEGRGVTFDGASYLAANADLQAAFGGDVAAATRHYITNGYYEGRATTGTSSGTGGITTTAPPAVSEGAGDLPANTSTSGYVGVGQSATGSISLYDRDWFRTELTAGQSVIIEARGSASGGGTLYDPELYLRNSSGSLLAYNLDSGAGYDAYLHYTPSQSGTFYLDVDGYSYYTGSYTLSVASASGNRPAALAADDGDRIAPAGLTADDLAWQQPGSTAVDGLI